MWIPTRARPLLGFRQTGDLGPFTIYTSRRRKPVWFLKSPPMKPPSPMQRHQRSRFTMAARAWQQLSPGIRKRWSLAAARARLYLSGYNLWLHYQLAPDRRALRTIELQSRIQLIDD